MGNRNLAFGKWYFDDDVADIFQTGSYTPHPDWKSPGSRRKYFNRMKISSDPEVRELHEGLVLLVSALPTSVATGIKARFDKSPKYSERMLELATQKFLEQPEKALEWVLINKAIPVDVVTKILGVNDNTLKDFLPKSIYDAITTYKTK